MQQEAAPPTHTPGYPTGPVRLCATDACVCCMQAGWSPCGPLSANACRWRGQLSCSLLPARGRAYHHHEREAQGARRRRVRRDCALHKGCGRVRQAGNGCVRAALPHAAQQGAQASSRAGHCGLARSALSLRRAQAMPTPAPAVRLCGGLRCKGTVRKTHSFLCSRAMHYWMPAKAAAKQYLWFSTTIFSKTQLYCILQQRSPPGQMRRMLHQAHAVPLPFKHTTRARLGRDYWQSTEVGRGLISISHN